MMAPGPRTRADGRKKPAADPLPGREPYDAGGREAANALLTTSITWSAV